MKKFPRCIDASIEPAHEAIKFDFEVWDDDASEFATLEVPPAVPNELWIPDDEIDSL